MQWQLTPYAVPLIVSGVLMIIIINMAWQRRHTRGVQMLMLLAASSAVYLFGYVGELGSSTLEGVQFWIGVEYAGITIVPVSMLLLVLAYTGNPHYHDGLTLSLLIITPALTWLFAITNNQHELMWRDMHLVPYNGIWLMEFSPGPWYLVDATYTWLLSLLGLTLLVREWRQTVGTFRRQTTILIIGVIIPLVGYVLFLSGILNTNLDFNTYFIAISSVVIAIAIFQYHLIDLMPVARDTVLVNMQDAVFVLDDRQRVIYVNPAAETIARLAFGIDIRNFIGQEITQHGLRNDAVWQTMIDVKSNHIDIELPFEAGEIHHFDLYRTDLGREANRKEGNILVLSDVTRRVRSEQELKNTNERLNILLQIERELTQELSVDYVASLMLDAAMRVSNADVALIGLMDGDQIKIAQAVGSVPQTLLEAAIPLEGGIIGRVVRLGQAEWVEDVHHDSDYIARIPGMRAQISVPLISSGKAIGILNLETRHPARFNQDIFETVRLLALSAAVAIDNAHAYEERDRLVKELETFSHTVAHDLKNPLSGIIGFATLLRDFRDDFPREDVQDQIETILFSAEKAVSIIDDLLLLAGLRSSKKMELGPVDMAQVTESVTLRLRHMIDEAGATLTKPDAWPLVIGYAPWIEEIWANYISNAIKYGGTPPAITLGYDRPAPDKIRWWVKDNGTGITAKDQARLFQPFSRVNKNPNVKGHGLGLSIVQRIAEKLNGTVGLESTVGQGSCFYFILAADTEVESQ